MNSNVREYGLPRAQVLLGRWQLSQVAVKFLKEECTQHVSSNELANLRREAEMLQALNHPAILRFYGACSTCKPVSTSATADAMLLDDCSIQSLSALRTQVSAGWLCADDTHQRGTSAQCRIHPNRACLSFSLESHSLRHLLLSL